MQSGKIARTEVALSLITLLTACTTSSDRITSSSPRFGALRDVGDDANPVVQSVTGHWEVIGRSGNLNKLSVNALKRLDGTVTGELQYEQFTDEGLSTVAHGAVICLTIDGNTARIGAMGDKPDQNGVTQFGYMTAIDNGEGANDPPDRASNLVAPTTEARVRLHCQGPSLTQNIFDIQRGNIQVRSGT